MKKLRSDSKWHRLPTKKREQVLRWLFDDGLSFEQALKRAKKEFGIKASATSLRRFYHHFSEERGEGVLAQAQGDKREFHDAALRIMSAATLSAFSRRNPLKALNQIIPVVKLMLKDKHEDLEERRLQFKQEKQGLTE